MSKKMKSGGIETTDRFKTLTWSDLEEWAGSKIISRGKSYQRDGCVNGLAVTASGDLVAWVHGTTRYATRVGFDKSGLASDCNCPFGETCKHAVAVVLEYLDCLKKGKNVPTATDKDERLSILKSGKTVYADALDDDDDFNFDDEDEDFEDVYEAREEKASHSKKKVSTKNDVTAFLQSRSKEELVGILSEILARNPEIRDEIKFKSKITTGSAASIVKTVNLEIEKATEEPAWFNSWEDEGYTPDYSRVLAGLKKLLASGHTDEVVTLGQKLFVSGTEQVGQSDDDDGITAENIAFCLNIVFDALANCSLPAVDKLERAVNFELNDEYELCSGLDAFWKIKFPKKDWSAHADRLLSRLKTFKQEGGGDSISRDYRRDSISDAAVRALEQAGRKDEIIPLCMKEVQKTQSYERLVRLLHEAGRLEEAETSIRKGIADTREKLPGIASHLRETLMKIRADIKDWAFVAALRADEFIEDPGLQEFENLKKASEKIKVWPQVRAAAMLFLETGKRPDGRTGWPLPDTGLVLSVRSRGEKPPYTETLLDIAIHEKKVGEAIRWYDAYREDYPKRSSDDLDDRVAAAIAVSHPDRAIAIWKRMAEGHIARTSPNEYVIAAKYLRKIQKLLKEKRREEEWSRYLTRLRAENHRKRRLVEILDSFSGKPILSS